MDEWVKKGGNHEFSKNNCGRWRKRRQERDRRAKRNNTISKPRKTMQTHKLIIYNSQKQ
jgi:hypothetical protein